MSKRTDRSFPSNRKLLGVLLLIVGIGVLGGAIFWMRTPSSDRAQKPAPHDRQIAHQQFSSDEPFSITLYSPREGMLAAGSAVVRHQPDTQSLSREVLAGLFAGQLASPAPVLRDIRLRELYIDASGTAYIDLTLGPRKDTRASAWEEQLTIYAIVNTILQNGEEIKQVRLLLDGKETQTLAGHMDLSRTFTKRMDLVKR